MAEQKSSSSVASGGIGLAGLLTCALVVLKIAGVGIMADASWLWCFAPLVIVPILTIALIVFLTVVTMVLMSMAAREAPMKAAKNRVPPPVMVGAPVPPNAADVAAGLVVEWEPPVGGMSNAMVDGYRIHADEPDRSWLLFDRKNRQIAYGASEPNPKRAAALALAAHIVEQRDGKLVAAKAPEKTRTPGAIEWPVGTRLRATRDRPEGIDSAHAGEVFTVIRPHRWSADHRIVQTGGDEAMWAVAVGSPAWEVVVEQPQPRAWKVGDRVRLTGNAGDVVGCIGSIRRVALRGFVVAIDGYGGEWVFCDDQMEPYDAS